MTDPPVRLMHYDPRWRQEFEQTRSSIFFSCDGWITSAVHVGSTSISGLIARPTIDVIATALDDQGIDQSSRLIEGLNFRPVDSPLWADGAVTLVKPRLLDAEAAEATHRIFLVRQDSAILSRAVKLRDYLIRHPEIAIELEEIKVAVWKDAAGNLQTYQDKKSAFFAKIHDAMDA